MQDFGRGTSPAPVLPVFRRLVRLLAWSCALISRQASGRIAYRLSKSRYKTRHAYQTRRKPRYISCSGVIARALVLFPSYLYFDISTPKDFFKWSNEP